MKKIRSAIYTRKSAEEGLEQDFNSLDAQREACAGYCQVEAFRADPTPRYWQRRALKPHHLVARFELETST